MPSKSNKLMIVTGMAIIVVLCSCRLSSTPTNGGVGASSLSEVRVQMPPSKNVFKPKEGDAEVNAMRFIVKPKELSCANATNFDQTWAYNGSLSKSIAKKCDYSVVFSLGERKSADKEMVDYYRSEDTAVTASNLETSPVKINLRLSLTEEGKKATMPESVDLSQGGTPDPKPPTPTPIPPPSQPQGPQVVAVTVKGGYSPETITLKKGVPAKINYYRDENSGCTASVLIKDFGISKQLPAFQTTAVEFTPDKAGEFKFTCGMEMIEGKLIVTE